MTNSTSELLNLPLNFYSTSAVRPPWTIFYFAPEVMNTSRPKTRSDVFSRDEWTRVHQKAERKIRKLQLTTPKRMYIYEEGLIYIHKSTHAHSHTNIYITHTHTESSFSFLDTCIGYTHNAWTISLFSLTALTARYPLRFYTLFAVCTGT